MHPDDPYPKNTNKHIDSLISDTANILANVNDGEYGIIIAASPGENLPGMSLERPGRCFFYKIGSPEMTPAGYWMDWWEPDHQKYFGVSEQQYDQMPQKQRAELEAKLKLKLWVRSQYGNERTQHVAPLNWESIASLKLSWLIDPFGIIGWLIKSPQESYSNPPYYMITRSIEPSEDTGTNEVVYTLGYCKARDEEHVVNDYRKGLVMWSDFTSSYLEKCEKIRYVDDEKESSLQLTAEEDEKDIVKRDGLKLKVQNREGTKREGRNNSGERWERIMENDYGAIEGTVGADGGKLDFFMAKHYRDNQPVFIINQTELDSDKFDEHKIMLGFRTKKKAEDAYKNNYSKNWDHYTDVVEMSLPEFKKWMVDEKQIKKPAKEIKKEAALGIPSEEVNDRNYAIMEGKVEVPIDILSKDFENKLPIFNSSYEKFEIIKGYRPNFSGDFKYKYLLYAIDKEDISHLIQEGQYGEGNKLEEIYNKIKNPVIAGKKNNKIFICFWLPKDAEDRFDHIRGLEDELHLTLLYVPSIELTEEKKKEILSEISDLATKYRNVKCRFTGIGAFKSKELGDNPVVALVNVRDGAKLYTDLVKAVKKVAGGWEKKYDFIPHVTLKTDSNGRANLKDLKSFSWTCHNIGITFNDDDEKYLVDLDTGRVKESMKKKSWKLQNYDIERMQNKLVYYLADRYDRDMDSYAAQLTAEEDVAKLSDDQIVEKYQSIYGKPLYLRFSSLYINNTVKESDNESNIEETQGTQKNTPAQGPSQNNATPNEGTPQSNEKANIVYPTVEEIYTAHEESINNYGGLQGDREDTKGKIEAAIGRAQSGYGDQEFYPSLFEKAAVLLHSIVTTHPFVDGNKRTGFLSAIYFLHENGISVEESHELADIIIQVASDEAGYDHLLTWIQQNSYDIEKKHERAIKKLTILTPKQLHKISCISKYSEIEKIRERYGDNVSLYTLNDQILYTL